MFEILNRIANSSTREFYRDTELFFILNYLFLGHDYLVMTLELQSIEVVAKLVSDENESARRNRKDHSILFIYIII